MKQIERKILQGVAAFAVAFASFFAAGKCYAQTLSGYDVMKKADDVPEPKTSSYTATMTLVNKKGQTRVREVIERSKDYGEVKKSVIVFVTPKDVAGVGYLMFEYPEKSDGTKKDGDNWLYMPAMKKTKRISGSETGGDFMGTDFTYDDMGDRGLKKDDFALLGTENVEVEGGIGGVSSVSCYKVECIAKDKSEKNPRRILWISCDEFLLVKGEFYDRQNELQRTLICSDYGKQGGFWKTGKMVMTNVQTDHSTTIEMKNVVYNNAIDDNMFTVSALENGRVR